MPNNKAPQIRGVDSSTELLQLLNEFNKELFTLTSYGFLLTVALASNALASRIVFPSVGATLRFFQSAGFASFAGQTKREFEAPFFVMRQSLVFGKARKDIT